MLLGFSYSMTTPWWTASARPRNVEGLTAFSYLGVGRSGRASRMTISTATRRSSSEEEEATPLLSFFVTLARSGFAVLLKRPPGPRLTQARLDFSMKCLKHKQIQGPWCITSDTAQRIVLKTLVDS